VCDFWVRTVYPEKLSALGLEYLRRNAAECEELNRIIMDELVTARGTHPKRALRVISKCCLHKLKRRNSGHA
jgi:aspartate/glutamate racemase